MSEPPTIRVGSPKPARQLFIPVVGENADLCDRFIRTAMAGREAPFGEIELEGWALLLKRMSEPPDRDPTWAPRFSVADGALLLAQHLDRASLTALSERLQAVPNRDERPLILLFCRPEGVREFKIGCPICGQKLWVQDAEIGKMGRCVRCDARIEIVSPADVLRRELQLSDRTPILSVDPTDAGLCRGAIANLIARKGFGVRPDSGVSPADFLKKATVPIRSS